MSASRSLWHPTPSEATGGALVRSSRSVLRASRCVADTPATYLRRSGNGRLSTVSRRPEGLNVLVLVMVRPRTSGASSHSEQQLRLACPPTRALSGSQEFLRVMTLLHDGENIRDTYEVERFLGEGAFAEVY